MAVVNNEHYKQWKKLICTTNDCGGKLRYSPVYGSHYNDAGKLVRNNNPAPVYICIKCAYNYMACLGCKVPMPECDCGDWHCSWGSHESTCIRVNGIYIPDNYYC